MASLWIEQQPPSLFEVGKPLSPPMVVRFAPPDARGNWAGYASVVGADTNAVIETGVGNNRVINAANPLDSSGALVFDFQDLAIDNIGDYKIKVSVFATEANHDMVSIGEEVTSSKIKIRAK